MGYHKKQIRHGKWKEFSKIQEEFDELEDAHEQGVKLMELCELSDLYGAIEGYVEDKYGLGMNDIAMMSARTSSAFADGTRCSHQEEPDKADPLGEDEQVIRDTRSLILLLNDVYIASQDLWHSDHLSFFDDHNPPALTKVIRAYKDAVKAYRSGCEDVSKEDPDV